MMERRRRRQRERRRIDSQLGVGLMLVVATTVQLTTCDASGQEPQPPQQQQVQQGSAAEGYTLAVESDAPDVLSYDAIASRLASELRAKIAPPSSSTTAATTTKTSPRAAITIRYRAGSASDLGGSPSNANAQLTVRVVHAGDRVVERTIVAPSDSASVRAEAVLLAGNLARDEARELLDQLTAPKKAPDTEPPPPPDTSPPAPAAPKELEEESERWLATFAVVHPLATNHAHPNVHTRLDFSMFYGRIGRSDALQLGFIVAHASRGSSGAQLGGAVALNEGSISGVQASVGTAITRKRVDGAQIATGFNFARDGVDGLQFAAGGNMTHGSLRGLQLSSIMNMATTDVVGAQATAWVNLADKLRGVQLAVVNIGSDVNGAQLGVLNIGRRVKGLQLGAVNIAEEVDGAAIGLASIARDAIHPIVWGGNLAYTNVGVKFKTKYVYTVTAVGVGSHEMALRGTLSFTAALGGHLPLTEAFGLDAELAYSQIDLDEQTNHALHPRFLAGYAFAKRLRVFAGGGPRVPLSFDRGSPVVRPEIIGGVQF